MRYGVRTPLFSTHKDSSILKVNSLSLPLLYLSHSAPAYDHGEHLILPCFSIAKQSLIARFTPSPAMQLALHEMICLVRALTSRFEFEPLHPGERKMVDGFTPFIDGEFWLNVKVLDAKDHDV